MKVKISQKQIIYGLQCKKLCELEKNLQFKNQKSNLITLHGELIMHMNIKKQKFIQFQELAKYCK